MNKSCVIGFVSGLVVGAGSAYIFLKKEFEAKLDDEIDEAVESTKSKLGSYVNKDEKAEKPKEKETEEPKKKSKPTDPKPDLYDYVTRVKKYISPDGDDEEVKEPYFITAEKFGNKLKEDEEDEHYDIERLKYFADGIMTNEQFAEFSDDDIDATISLDIYSHLAEYEEEVYVRNERQEIDYLIEYMIETFDEYCERKPYIKET